MISELFDGVVNFFADTVVLLVSGCVSLLVLSGGLATLAVFGARQLKCVRYVQDGLSYHPVSSSSGH